MIISAFLLFALLASMFFWPHLTPWLSLILLLIGLGMPIFLAVQKHWQKFNQAECTREKMVRNLVLDLLGLLIIMAVAMYGGRLAGGYFGFRAGFWVGILAGFVGGFLAAWMARFAWGKLTSALA